MTAMLRNGICPNLLNTQRGGRWTACVYAQIVVRAYCEAIENEFYEIIRTYDIRPGHIREISELWGYHEKCKEMHSMHHAKEIIEVVERIEKEKENGYIV